MNRQKKKKKKKKKRVKESSGPVQEGMRANKNRGENKRELSTGGMLIPAYLAGRWLKYRYFYLQSGQITHILQISGSQQVGRDPKVSLLSFRIRDIKKYYVVEKSQMDHKRQKGFKMHF